MLDRFCQHHATRVSVAIACVASLTALFGCGPGKLERCQFLEIEGAEFEIDFGDVDIERAEVEMNCDGTIVDVTWPEFRRKINVDPGAFGGDIRALSRAVSCGMYEREDKDVFGVKQTQRSSQLH